MTDPSTTPHGQQLVVTIRAGAVGDTVTLGVDRCCWRVDLRLKLEADPHS